MENVEKHVQKVNSWKAVSQEVFVKCNSHEFGKSVKANCSAGCIGCGACTKVCPVEAITLDNKLAVVDHQKCIGL